MKVRKYSNYHPFSMNIILHFILIYYLISPTDGATTTAAPGSCYFGSQISSGKLPANATIVQCKSGCQKSFVIAESLLKVNTYWVWGCADEILDWPIKNYTYCGESVEQAYGQQNITFYHQICTCCGTLCNSHSLDTACNGEVSKRRNKTCYYTEDKHTDPAIPTLDLGTVRVTDAAVCFKSFETIGELTNYYWAGVSLHVRTGDHCGDSIRMPGDNYDAHICTCCQSNNCNNQSFDPLSPENPTCDESDLTTVEIPTSTPIFTSTADNGFTCFTALSDNGELPDEAGKLICSNGCEKTQFRANKTMTISGESVLTYGFTWGCAGSLDNPLQSFHKCGDTYEFAIGQLDSTDQEYTLTTVTRVCTCCEKECNGIDFNTKCLGAFELTKSCYSYYADDANDDPRIPDSKRVEIRVSESTSCYKFSGYLAEEINYEWGAITTPQSCGQGYNDSTGNSICTCCGNLCNDASYDGITVDNPDCVTGTAAPPPTTTLPPGSGILCYSAVSDSAALPHHPEWVRCPIGCMKTFVLNTSNAENSFYYMWGCAEPYLDWPQKNFHVCGDTIERSEGWKHSDGRTESYYIASCTCCSDSCNGDAMIGSCNSPLDDFTGKCFGQRSENPDLDMNKVASLPITYRMKCFKTVEVHNGVTYFNWAAVDIPLRLGSCGDGFSIVDIDYEATTCTCCQDNCNDVSFDHVTKENQNCLPGGSSTTPTPTPGPSDARYCFNAYSPHGHLIENPQISRCNLGCQKTHEVTVTFSPGTGEPLIADESYYWNCADDLQILNIDDLWQCGDTIKYVQARSDAAVYKQSCTCCGEKCNRDLDTVCNEPFPLNSFTKQCYVTDSIMRYSPELSENSPVKALVSHDFYCLKSLQTSQFVSGYYDYWWGAVVLPSNHSCGDSFLDDEDDRYLAQTCTCCGSLCNDASYDKVTGRHYQCPAAFESTSPTTIQESTATETTTQALGSSSSSTTQLIVITTTENENQPTNAPDDDSTLYIVIGVVSGVLAIVSIIAAIFGYRWYKNKNQRNIDAYPMMPQFDELPPIITTVDVPRDTNNDAIPRIVSMSGGRALGYSKLDED